MNENFSNSGDEILEASLSAMRGRAVPDGPPETRIAETIAAMRGAAAQKPNIFSRVNNMKFITGMAASVLLVIGAVVVAILMLRSPEMTFGEVVDMVRKAHTMSFVSTTAATSKTPRTRMKMLMNDQGQISMRSENGMRMIMDMKIGRMMSMEPITKTAFVMDMKNFPKQPNGPGDLIEQFKKLQGDSAKDMGKTDIDGRKAEKFVAAQDGMDYVVWGDPQTREPIRVDVTINVLDQKMTVSMTDFDFNPPVPDDEFSEKVPNGYTVQNFSLNMPDINNGEQNIVDLLRGYAHESEGKFPTKLDEMGPYMKLLERHPTSRPSQADMQMILGYTMVKHFLGTLPSGQWKYSGGGKMMGDGGALIFWYKSAKGYRGIYGDLTFKDLPAAPQ